MTFSQILRTLFLTFLMIRFLRLVFFIFSTRLYLIRSVGRLQSYSTNKSGFARRLLFVFSKIGPTDKANFLLAIKPSGGNAEYLLKAIDNYLRIVKNKNVIYEATRIIAGLNNGASFLELYKSSGLCDDLAVVLMSSCFTKACDRSARYISSLDKIKRNIHSSIPIMQLVSTSASWFISRAIRGQSWKSEIEVIFDLFIVCYLLITNKNVLYHHLKTYIDSIVLSIPIIGTAVSVYESLKLSIVLKYLTEGGYDILSAFAVAADNAGNLAYKRGIRSIILSVRMGRDLDKAIANSPLIPEELKIAISSANSSAGISIDNVISDLELKLGDMSCQISQIINLSGLTIAAIALTSTILDFNSAKETSRLLE